MITVLASAAEDSPARRASVGDGPPLSAGASPPYNQADQFSKNLLRDALSCASAPMPETEVEVLSATQRIDVYAIPDPARAAERPKMGLLGELSMEPSLFEPFRTTPGIQPIRRVLCKQLTWHHELERRAKTAARAAARAAEEGDDGAAPFVPFPWLVVICQGRPETVLERYGCKATRPGVYESVPALQVRVVVLAELPRTRETLLLRLLGAGRVLLGALEDLTALPEDAWEKSIARPLVLHFRLAKPSRPETNEEQDMNAEIRAWYEDYQKNQEKLLNESRNEGRSEGRNEGRAEEAARAVLTALRVRGLAVSEPVRERILAQKDPERLERWLERAIVATSVHEVLADPS